MNIDLYETLFPNIIEVFSALATELLPILIWILVPAIILNRLFGNKEAWNLGALLGLMAYFTLGRDIAFNFL
ncbi:hypothetical protein B481_2009 [Planococcus halocryophilus Or1]|uniref:Uncharacterized protein n=1 Tax=Planococcus halocryophilus TaxID=1215089 RepID=A0A1C7DPY7_9BACL|nr:hypothetical protein [Planococcus halocryophilus]ANU13477.1 hypothetical protein BBI08_06305 [Planococcus halocryophilus]EMF46282.1 hypothetical protein B481_2009 [Planococcus halocryophilus Or1]